MSREFKLNTDPNDNGIDLFKKKSITINPGVTVLVGCNGIGKTTLLKSIKARLEKEAIPAAHFNNLLDGGSNARSESAYYGDFEFFALSLQSSEGENIVLNLINLSKELGEFIRTGQYNVRKNALADAFKRANGSESDESTKKISNERWILFDAVDSGLSVDNIVDLKEGLFNTILENEKEKEIYIIISANEYEMANGESCFDVYHGEYLAFKDYEEYRTFILNSRKWKEKRDLELNDK